MSVRMEHYAFGRIDIDGRTYTADVVVYPDGTIDADWWRRQGHALAPADIAALLDARPAVIVVGTGYNGRMKPAAGLAAAAQQRGIELKVAQTGAAVDLFNDLAPDRPTGACLHLTC